MINTLPADFWTGLDQLAAACPPVIDRPRGSRHPRYPDILYPLDYGYLEGTSSTDGGGIDVWLGASGTRCLSAVILTVDPRKRDAEIKLLMGCSDNEIQIILDFHRQNNGVSPLLICR